jgi:hypothetical protein
VGIHTGRGIAAYRQIILANGGVFEGIRFRRAPSFTATQELFLSEAAQHVWIHSVSIISINGLERRHDCLLEVRGLRAALETGGSTGKSWKWEKLIFAVRVTATETRSAESSGFSFFECSGEKFMLVEGQQSQIRNNCPRELRGLEVAPQRIFAAGKETLEQSPDLQYATASEELPPDIPTTRGRGARTRLEESSEEDTEEEDEAGSEDDV